MAIGDISSLPQWAQKEFKSLQDQLAVASRKVAILQRESTGGVTRVRVGSEGVFLPDTQSIAFRVGDEQHERILGRVMPGWHRGHVLRITGETGINILPTSSSSVDIELRADLH